MVVRRSLRGVSPAPLDGPAAVPDANAACPLCGRLLVAGPSVNEHHLVPRSRGGKQAFAMHRVCHQKIHATLTETELARSYSNWEALRAHPEIAIFVRWVSRKPPEFVGRNDKTRELRQR